MREWTVAGGLVLGDAGLLLVRNRRRDGSHDWSPPGGVVEPGESTVEGLTREVAEETGVQVLAWHGPVYEVVVEAPDLGWRARVEAHLARAFEGELTVADPDGIVVEAAWVDPSTCAGRLEGGQRWVREPLVTWLAGWLDGGPTVDPLDPLGLPDPRDLLDSPAVPPRLFRYHVAGRDPSTAVVTALEGARPAHPWPERPGGEAAESGERAP